MSKFFLSRGAREKPWWVFLQNTHRSRGIAGRLHTICNELKNTLGLACEVHAKRPGITIHSEIVPVGFCRTHSDILQSSLECVAVCDPLYYLHESSSRVTMWRVFLLFAIFGCVSADCPPSFNALYTAFTYATAPDHRSLPVCIFLGVGKCPLPHLSRVSFVQFLPNSGFNGNTPGWVPLPFVYYNDNRTLGTSNIATIIGGRLVLPLAEPSPGGSASSFLSMDAVDNTWFPFKLFNNYPGTFFPSSSNYQIRPGYYWDGPLAGGTGLIKAGTAPTTPGIPSAPNNNVVVCHMYATTAGGSGHIFSSSYR